MLQTFIGRRQHGILMTMKLPSKNRESCLHRGLWKLYWRV